MNKTNLFLNLINIISIKLVLLLNNVIFQVVEKNNEIVELKKKLTKAATMESKIENIANLSLEQLPQQKIVELESEVITMIYEQH